jgi:hypothetical protein
LTEESLPNGPPIDEKIANIRKTEKRNKASGETNLARSPAT